MKIKLLFFILLSIVLALPAYAEPPSPQQVYDDMLRLWKDYQFEELEQYINSLYDKYPNYIPAILAKSFYYEAYKNDIITARDELSKIRSYLEPRLTPKLEPFFSELLYEIRELENDIEFYQKRGITLEEMKAADTLEALGETRELGDNFAPLTPTIIPDAPAMFIDESAE